MRHFLFYEFSKCEYDFQVFLLLKKNFILGTKNEEKSNSNDVARGFHFWIKCFC